MTRAGAGIHLVPACAPQFVRHAKRRRIAAEAEALELAGGPLHVAAGGDAPGSGDMMAGPHDLTAAELGAHAHRVCSGRPRIVAHRPKTSSCTGRDGARPNGIVSEEGPGQVVFGLAAGLGHSLASEDRRRMSEDPLGLDRVSGVPEHLGTVDIADRREDRRDVHEGVPRR